MCPETLRSSQVLNIAMSEMIATAMPTQIMAPVSGTAQDGTKSGLTPTRNELRASEPPAATLAAGRAASVCRGVSI